MLVRFFRFLMAKPDKGEDFKILMMKKYVNMQFTFVGEFVIIFKTKKLASL